MNRTGAFSFPGLTDAEDVELITIALDQSRVIGAVDLYEATITGNVTGFVYLQASTNGSNYYDAGPLVPVYATARHVRVPIDPGLVQSVTHLKLVLANGDDVAGEDFDTSGITVMQQSAVDEAVRFWPFSGPEGLAYMIAVTGRNGDVYRNGVYLASVPLPYSSSQVVRVQYDKRLDTLLAFHENVPPHRLFRDGGDFAWISEPQILENIPLTKFEGETYTNGVDEVQRLNFLSFGNETFNLQLDGETTGTLDFSIALGGPADNVTTIENALNSLTVLDGGSVSVVYISNGIYEITFDGGEAAQRKWPEIVGSIVTSTNGYIDTTTVTQGKEGGEPIVSAARGWFRTGFFWSGRLNLIGTKAFPLTALGSVFGEIENFKIANSRATDALEYEVDGDDDDGIRAALKTTRYPLLYTSGGVWYLPVDALSGETPPGALRAADDGFEDTVPPLTFDGGALYVAQGGRAVRELIFVDRNVGYVPATISLRVSHLIARPIDAAVRPAGREHTTGLYMLAKEDGELVVLNSIRDQEIRAWARETTPAGKFLAVGADKLGRTYRAVQRTAGEAVAYSIETEQADTYLDGAMKVTLDNASVITGAAHLNGQAIIAHDGVRVWTGLTCTSGVITLPEAMTGEIEVGLFFDVWIETLDVRETDPSRGTLSGLPKNLKSVWASLEDSLPPDMEAGPDIWPLAVPNDERVNDQAIFDGPLQDVMTGWVTQNDLTHVSRDMAVKFKRILPGPFRVRSVIVEVEV